MQRICGTFDADCTDIIMYAPAASQNKVLADTVVHPVKHGRDTVPVARRRGLVEPS